MVLPNPSVSESAFLRSKNLRVPEHAGETSQMMNVYVQYEFNKNSY